MSHRVGTVALVLRPTGGLETIATPTLVEALSDDFEIQLFEMATAKGEKDPLRVVLEYRKKQHEEDERFGDTIENLLSKPCLKPEIQEHGVKWFMSKIKMEKFKRSEREATRIIAEYAFGIFLEDPARRDFLLASERAKVRVKIFELPQDPSLQSRGIA